MRQAADPASRNLVPSVVILAFLLVASIWGATYLSAEARVRRATVRVAALVEKRGEESPVSLGLAANRLGKFLATNAVLELEDYGPLATGRQEIVSLFAQIRASLAIMAFLRPEIVVGVVGKGAVDAHVAVRYRLAPNEGDVAEGDGKAQLHWTKGKDGWQISRATLRAEKDASVPKGWK